MHEPARCSAGVSPAILPAAGVDCSIELAESLLKVYSPWRVVSGTQIRRLIAFASAVDVTSHLS
jgi:hypothetical protein